MMMLTHISFWNMLVDICIRLRMMNAVQRSKSPLAGLSPIDRRHWPNNAGHPSRMWIYYSTIIRNSLNLHVVMKKKVKNLRESNFAREKLGTCVFC